MVKISEETLKKFLDEGFFNEWKSIEEIISRLTKKGFSIKGKKIGMISRMLTLLCQKDVLERKKDENGNWSYKKNE